ncbi:MAG: FAD-dependent oxidoreductase [Alphaproteobacteria bacterium]|jgi:D-amino-acid dehydrogenase
MKVVVVGAGIVGTCSASYLLRDGHDVVLVDSDGPGEGCSKGNAGALSPGSCIPMSGPGVLSKIPGWLSDPLGPLRIRPGYLATALPWLIRFTLAGRRGKIAGLADALLAINAGTFENYAPLLQNAGCQDLIRRSGALTVYKTNRHLADSHRERRLREERQIRQRILGAGELRDLVPELSSDYKHGVLLPDHGFVTNPYRLVRHLAERFARDGGQLERRRVTGITLRDGRVAGVATTGGGLVAERVVIAAGAWSNRLIEGLGVRVPLESQRGYHATIQGSGIAPALTVVSAEAKVYATPMEDGLRLAGTVEFAGLDAAPDFRRAEALIVLAKDMFPALAPGAASHWMGHRPCLPDSLPVIGAAPGHPNLLLAFGHGHHGMTGASTTGAIIASLVSGRQPPIDPTPYRPDRF